MGWRHAHLLTCYMCGGHVVFFLLRSDIGQNSVFILSLGNPLRT